MTAGEPRRRCSGHRARNGWQAVLLALLCYAGAAAGAVTARLEPPVIDELETTRLVLRSSGGTAVQALDLSALAGDFEVLGTQTASQYRAVDGAIEAWVEYQITLQPTREGTLTIPSLEVGGERTAPLTLEVRSIDPATRAAIDRMAFFELEVNPNPVYLRAEAILARRLYYSAQTQIYSDLPGTPEIPDALVLPIGETRSGTVVRDGERYGVIEQRFAIYPERVGTLTVPPIFLTSSMRLPVDGQLRRTGARIASQPLAIEVLPIPAEYPDDAPWLPARSIALTDRWTPDRAVYQVGEALTRRIEVRVTGNLAASITPPLDAVPESAFRQYAEPAVLSDDRSGPSVIGTRTTEYSIMPTAPGAVELPALTLTWWDVDAARVRTSEIPAREVVVEGIAPGQSGQSRDALAQDVAAPPAEAAAGVGPAGDAATRTTTGRRLTWAAAACAGALALWLGAGWVRAHRTAFLRNLRRTAQRAVPSGRARAIRLRRLRRRLRRSDGNAAAMQSALHEHLCCWYGTTPGQALARFRAAGHGPLLDRLLAARFGRNAPPPPAARELLAALDALTPTVPPAPDPLPELFAGR